MSILQNILDRVSGQVNENYFREQLIQELGATNFDSDAADTGGFAAGQLYFLYSFYITIFISIQTEDLEKQYLTDLV